MPFRIEEASITPELERCILRCISFRPNHRPEARDFFNLSESVLEQQVSFRKAVQKHQLLPAARNDRFLRVMELLNNGAISSINTRAGTDGETLLHKGARLNINGDMFQSMLTKGANPRLRSHSRETPLHTAASSNSVEMIIILLDHGASALAQDRRGWT